MSQETIKPCPRCGMKPEQFSIHNAYRCLLSSPCARDGGWMSLANFNRRTPSELDRLKDAVVSCARGFQEQHALIRRDGCGCPLCLAVDALAAHEAGQEKPK